ncbi:MAG: serine/threonine-protein kinase, partial [Acidobacteria bacterium]|nr:serine/threonine-protein kinase [Acidobacteriota bacterium]
TQVADAMAHAHERGIIHRDLKSSNVLITPESQVKLLDFGLAKQLRDEELNAATRSTLSLTEAGTIAGTLPCMAPELLRGEPADARSDVWALGVLLYEMAKGELPFQGRTGFELSTAILRESPAPLPTQISPGLRAVILRCLTKQPGQRYQHASEVHAALEALQSDAVLASPVPARASPRRWLWIVAGVALAVLAVAGFLLKNRELGSLASPAPGGRLTLLVSSEGEAKDPALSPDGKMIAYVAEDGGKLDLFVSRVAGGERVRLTSDAAHEARPAFSPDSEHVAFTRLRADASPEICVIPSLGGEAVPVAAGALHPAWSPDGTRLAFVLRKPGQPEELATAAADGTDLRIILPGDGDYPFLLHPSWSPDASQVAVVRSTGGIAREIWLVPSRGGLPRRLSADPPGVFSNEPVFTAEGRGLVHASNRAGATNLWLMPLNGKPSVRLTTGPGPDESPSVARDGTVAFLNSRWRATLLLHSLETGETRTLFTYSSTLWAPSFSPDGREVAFSRTEVDGSWHIWMVPVEGGPPRQLTSGKLPEIYPRFTPDGSSVLFFTWGPQPNRVWRVPRGGGPAVPLTPARKQDDAYADPSPDGRWLAFTRTEGGKARIVVAPLAGGEARQLTGSSSTVARWSPDGKWIAFSPDRSYTAGIFIIHADGTGLRRLTETGGWPVWWPDGKQIGYQALGPDGNEQIRAVPLEGGPSSPLATLRFAGTNYPFDVSPDGQRLATTNSVHLSDEIWLLRPPRREIMTWPPQARE